MELYRWACLKLSAACLWLELKACPTTTQLIFFFFLKPADPSWWYLSVPGCGIIHWGLWNLNSVHPPKEKGSFLPSQLSASSNSSASGGVFGGSLLPVLELWIALLLCRSLCRQSQLLLLRYCNQYCKFWLAYITLSVDIQNPSGLYTLELSTKV